MNQRAKLFTKSGRLRGVSFCAPSDKRRAMLVVSCNDATGKKITSQFSIYKTDFDEAWQTAIHHLAQMKGITDPDLIDEMLATSLEFIERYNLDLVPARMLVLS